MDEGKTDTPDDGIIVMLNFRLPALEFPLSTIILSGLNGNCLLLWGSCIFSSLLDYVYI